MSGPRRRGGLGGGLLLALATGALMIACLALAGPGTAFPASWQAALGAPAPRPPPPPPMPPVVQVPVLLPPPPAPATVSPTPTPRPAPTPPRRPAPSGPAAGVVAATNAARDRAGCPALTTDSRLSAAAQAHSVDMAKNDYFSHTSLDGRTFVDRIRAAGHPHPGAENIAYGHSDAAGVVTAWMRSPGHRRNILDCSLTEIGVGFDRRGNYWTQDFGR